MLARDLPNGLPYSPTSTSRDSVFWSPDVACFLCCDSIPTIALCASPDHRFQQSTWRESWFARDERNLHRCPRQGFSRAIARRIPRRAQRGVRAREGVAELYLPPLESLRIRVHRPE